MSADLLKGVSLKDPGYATTNEVREIANIKESILGMKNYPINNDSFEYEKQVSKENNANTTDNFQKTTTEEEVKKQCFIRGALSFFLPGINDLIEDKNVLKFAGLLGLSTLAGCFSPILALAVRTYSAITTAITTKNRAQVENQIVKSKAEISQEEQQYAPQEQTIEAQEIQQQDQQPNNKAQDDMEETNKTILASHQG